MKTLPVDFNRGGWHFRQRCREGEWAIYLKTKESAAGGGVISSWEVIRLRVKPEREAFGKTLPETEWYPSDEDWGNHGWSCPSEQAAYEWLAKMRERFRKPSPEGGEGPSGGGAARRTPPKAFGRSGREIRSSAEKEEK